MIFRFQLADSMEGVAVQCEPTELNVQLNDSDENRHAWKFSLTFNVRKILLDM